MPPRTKEELEQGLEAIISEAMQSQNDDTYEKALSALVSIKGKTNVNGTHNRVNSPDIKTQHEHEPDISNPNVITCYQCHKTSYKHSLCHRCNYDIPKHEQDILDKALAEAARVKADADRKHLNKVVGWYISIGVGGAVAGMVGDNLGIDGLHVAGVAVFFIGLVGAIITNKGQR